MEKIRNAQQLRSMIRLLEQNVSRQEQVIREDAACFLENLKPVNILKQTARQVFTKEPGLKSGLFKIAAGAGIGFLLKKAFNLLPSARGGKLLYGLIEQGVASFFSHRAQKKKQLIF